MPPVSKKPPIKADFEVTNADYDLFEALSKGIAHRPNTNGDKSKRPVSEEVYRSIRTRLSQARLITDLGTRPSKPIALLSPELFKTYIAKKMAGAIFKQRNGEHYSLHDFETETRIFSAVIERFENEVENGRTTINKIPTFKVHDKFSLDYFNEEIYASIVAALHTLCAQHHVNSKHEIISEKTLQDLRRRGLLRIGSLLELKDVRDAVSKLVGIEPEKITQIVAKIESRNSIQLTDTLLTLRQNELDLNDQVLETPVATNIPLVEIVLGPKDKKLIELDKMMHRFQVRHMQALAIYSVIAEFTEYHPCVQNESLAENIARCFEESFMPQTSLLIMAATKRAIAIESANVIVGKSTEDLVTGLKIKLLLEKHLIRSSTVCVEALLAIAKTTEYIDRLEHDAEVSQKQINALGNILYKIEGVITETLTSLHPEVGDQFGEQTIIDTNKDWAIIDRYEPKLLDSQNYTDQEVEAASYTYLLPLSITRRILGGQFHGRALGSNLELIEHTDENKLIRNIFGFSQVGGFDPISAGFPIIDFNAVRLRIISEPIYQQINAMLALIEESKTTMYSINPPSSDTSSESLIPGGSSFSMISTVQMPPPITLPSTFHMIGK